MISVLYFSNTLARGGAEEHILTLLRGLDRHRFRPALVCTPEVAEKIRRDVPRDVPLTALRLRKPYEIGAASALLSIMRARRPDIVHSHLFYSSLFASPIAALARVPLVVETPHLRESWRRGLKARYVVDRIAGRFVDQYIAVSDANGRYLVEEKRHLRNQDVGVVIEQLTRHRAELPRDHAGVRVLLLAPHVRVQQAVALERAGIDYVDLAGNVHLQAPGLFVHVEGRKLPAEPNTAPTPSAGEPVRIPYRP